MSVQSRAVVPSIWGAAYAGHLDHVRQLLGNDALLINARDAGGRGDTSLIIAAERGHLEICKFLIQLGATLDLRGRASRTALRTALQQGHLEIAEVLLRAGADPTLPDEDGSTPFHSVASMNYRSRLADPLTAHAHVVTDVPEDPQDARHYAIARLLVERGANPNAEKEHGSTPLHVAAG